MMLGNVSKLLSETNIRLKALNQFRERYGSLLASDFFILDYLRNDEIGLTNIIVELLTPKGSHAQGTLFTEAFIESAGLNDNWKEGIENIEVKSEVSTQEGRPDIVIDYKDGRAIIIENKPWAREQKNQLQRYAEYGETQYQGKGWILIYISNNEPTSLKRESLKKDQFKHIRYDKEILSWLEQTSLKVKPLHLRVFLEELYRWIDKYVNWRIPMEESKEIIEVITENPDNLKSAFRIYEIFPKIHDKLIEDLNRKLYQEVKEAGFSIFSEKRLGGEKYDLIIIDITPKKDRDAKIYVCFSFEGKRCKNFIWGISVRGRLLEKLEKENLDTDAKAKEIREANEDIWTEIKNVMDKEFSISGKSSDWWPWYDDEKEFGMGYKDWSHNIEPWIDIYEGELPKKIVELSKRVKEAFETKNKLDLFYSLKI